MNLDASPAVSEPADAGAREPSSDEEWQHRRRRVSSSAARSGRSTPLPFEFESASAAGRGEEGEFLPVCKVITICRWQKRWSPSCSRLEGSIVRTSLAVMVAVPLLFFAFGQRAPLPEQRS